MGGNLKDSLNLSLKINYIICRCFNVSRRVHNWKHLRIVFVCLCIIFFWKAAPKMVFPKIKCNCSRIVLKSLTSPWTHQPFDFSVSFILDILENHSHYNHKNLFFLLLNNYRLIKENSWLACVFSLSLHSLLFCALCLMVCSSNNGMVMNIFEIDGEACASWAMHIDIRM